jgi:hypothetical protein
MALYFTIRTFGQTRNTHQIQLGERFYSEMQQVRRDLSPYFDLDKTSQAYQDKIKLQDEITFKTLEWYSLLIRGKKMKDKSVINYFRNEIIEWHDKIFFEVVEDKDRSKYKEFQELVKELKLGKYTPSRFKGFKGFRRRHVTTSRN